MARYVWMTWRYLTQMLPGALAALALYGCLYPWRRRKLRAAGLASSRPRECLLALFWMFSGGMAVLTLCPQPEWLWAGLQGYWAPYFGGWALPLAHRVNLLPFSQGDSLLNLLGNVVMFLPFGFSLPLLWRGWHWRRTLLLGLAATGGIESWQLLIGRYFDVDDILLNTLGVLCGFLLWKELDHWLPQGLWQLRCKPGKARVRAWQE